MEPIYNGQRHLYCWEVAERIKLSARERADTVMKVKLEYGLYKLEFEESEPSETAKGLALIYPNTDDIKIVYWSNFSIPNQADSGEKFVTVDRTCNLILVENDEYKGYYDIKISKLQEKRILTYRKACFRCGNSSHLISRCPLKKEHNTKRRNKFCYCPYCKHKRQQSILNQ